MVLRKEKRNPLRRKQRLIVQLFLMWHMSTTTIHLITAKKVQIYLGTILSFALMQDI